jgi:hypothetical protein
MSDPAVRDHGGNVILELSGELGMAEAARLGAAVSAAVSRRPVIEVDLSPRRPWGAPSEPFWRFRWVV